MIMAEWIDVNERLPAPYNTVLIALKFKSGKKWIQEVDVATYKGGHKWETFNDWDEGQEIIFSHWMPLPEPPEQIKERF
jgi:hypothetical protein